MTINDIIVNVKALLQLNLHFRLYRKKCDNMEDSFTKIIWIAVSAVVIMIIYGILKLFIPKLLNKIQDKVIDFVTSAFDSMTGTGDNNSSGGK